MLQQLKPFLVDDSGATMIEYVLVAALVSVAGIVAMDSLGGSLSSLFGSVADEVTRVTPSAS